MFLTAFVVWFLERTMVDKPKIIEHVVKSLDYTLFDARWIPCSARFVVLGNYARGTGAFQIYEVSKGDVKLLKSVSVCCCTNSVLSINR